MPLTSSKCSPPSNPASLLQTTTTIPKYFYNDYLKRVSNSFDATRDNPAALSVPAGADTEVFEACPIALHAFYSVVSSEGKPADVKARVFSPTDVAASLSPALGFLGDDRFFVRFSGATPPFAIKPLGGADKNRGYKEATFKSTAEGLFVPSGYAVAFKNSGGDKISILRHCFADASNLNRVKSNLRLQSFVSKDAERLLSSLSVPTFDTTMERNAKHEAYERHLQWPRSVSDEEGQGGGAKGEGSASSGGDENEKAKKRRERKNRKKNKKTFGDWQAAKAWDHKVLGLTLPTLEAPSIVEVGRKNATLAWKCPFELREGDSATLSFEVEWDGVGIDGEANLNGSTIFKASSPLLSSSVATDSTSQSYGVTTTKYTATVLGLSPGSRYHFKVALRYGEGEEEDDVSTSPISLPSLLSTTKHEGAPLPISSAAVVVAPKDWDALFHPKFNPVHGSEATMVLLKFLSPSDDGGRQIEGYEILR